MSKSTSRREFICTGSQCVALTLAALGVPNEVWALPMKALNGVRAGSEKTYPIPTADGVSIDHAEQAILVRWAGKVMAFSLACPHENAAVKWVEKDQRFACTKHDSKYQPDGTHISGRATRNMDRMPIKKNGASVVVDLDKAFHSDTDAAGWSAAVVAV